MPNEGPDARTPRQRGTRRQLLKGLGGTGAALAVAGCIADGGTPDGTADDVDERGDFVGPDGQVELTFVYPTGSDTVETVSTFIGQELEDIGFAVEFESLQLGNLIDRYVETEYVGEGDSPFGALYNAGPREETESENPWDVMYGLQFNTYPRTPAAMSTFWHREAPINFFGYEPEADTLGKFDEFRTEPDPEVRAATMAEILGVLSDDVPVNFLSMSDDIIGYREYLEGPEEAFGANWNGYQTWEFTTGENEYVRGEASDAETLYFPVATDNHSELRISLVLDGAYQIDENNDVRPLWLDITDTGDGQVYVCELRDDLEWGDGYGQMTAEDWVYQIEEVHKHEDNWANSAHQGDWSRIERAERTGKLEFQIELADVNPDFPLEPPMWGAYCAPKDLYEEYRPDGEALARSAAFQELRFSGNLGPYTFERWDRSAEFVVTRNDDYYARTADDLGDAWSDAPHFDTYTFRVIEEESNRLRALERDEVTQATVPEDRFDQFEDLEGVDVYEIPQPHLTVMAMNQRRNGWTEFRTKEVRQALCTAIDKRAITEGIQRGLAEFTHTFQPRWSEWYDDGQVTEFGVDETYDKERARDLLEKHTSDEYGYE